MWNNDTHRPPFRPRTTRSLCTSLLLLILTSGDIEINPGPTSINNLEFGCYNVRSAVIKASSLHDIIHDNKLSILALSETWITGDSPPASGVTSSRAPGGKMLLSRPSPLRFNVECFYSIVNHQIQRVRSAVNISSIWCFLPHKSLDPMAYRGFLAPGAKMGIDAPPFSVSDWQAQRRSPSLLGGGGSGAESSATNAFGTWEQLGVNGAHF